MRYVLSGLPCAVTFAMPLLLPLYLSVIVTVVVHGRHERIAAIGICTHRFSDTPDDDCKSVRLQRGPSSKRLSAFQTERRPELVRITVPVTVLYVVPSNVPLTPEQFDGAMRESYANVPHARLIRVDHSNHFIMFDQPARVIAEVDTLMRQQPPSRN